jgi:nucleotide-binding universal stress UspA family protein
VSAHGALQAPSDAKVALTVATRAAHAEGLEAVTHARRGELAGALLAVAEEQHADLLVVGSTGISRAPRSLLGSLADKVSHHDPAASSSSATTRPKFPCSALVGPVQSEPAPSAQ